MFAPAMHKFFVDSGTLCNECQGIQNDYEETIYKQAVEGG
jgi:hypothetical protein